MSEEHWELPSKVEVGPYRMQVVAKNRDLENASADGTSSTHMGEIEMRNDHPSYIFTASTLLHETLHVCCRVSGIQSDDEMNEEAFIWRLTDPLLDALRRNPELVTFLTAPAES